MTRDDIMAFIRQDIGSVYALELLLLVQRHSGRSWRAGDLVRELRSSATAVAEALSRLTDAGFVLERAGGRYVFAPRSPWHETIATQIEEIYSSTPISVINAIVGASGHPGRTVEPHK